MNYKVVIMYDTEYEGYIVDVPELEGCMSQRKTMDEAIANIKNAIKGWLLVEKKHGRKHSSDKSQVFFGEVSL